MFDAWFTYLTGGIGLLSFVLQIKPFFPKYQNAIRAVLLFASGAFVGSLLTSFSGTQIKIELTGSPLYLMIIAVQMAAVIFAFLFLVVGWIRDRHVENVAAPAVSLFGLFFALLIVHAFMSIPGPRKDADIVETQEFIVLAKDAESRGDLTRAIRHYERAFYQIPQSNPARKSLQQYVDDLKQQQYSIERKK
jgi:hypothetical protein